MITKINTIQNVGRFKKCSPSNNDHFTKFTFLYADNGSGKTTFCNILRSLKTGDIRFLIGRKTLGSTNDICVSLEAVGKNINYQNGSWTETLPDIQIFDDTYIHDNVYATDGITHDHKRNLYQVIIGNEGVEYAKEYERLDLETRTASDKVRQQESAIQNHLLQGVLFKELATLSLPDDIETKISDAEKNLAAIRESVALRAHASVQAVSLPEVPDSFESVLTETIDGVVKDVSDKVTQHIASHNMQGRGEQWLSEGLQFQTESCPYCAQELSSSELKPFIEGFFSVSYKGLKLKVDRLQTEILTIFSDRVISLLKIEITNNSNNLIFWSQYCDVKLPEVDMVAIEKSLVDVRSEISKLMQRKMQSVLEPVDFDSSFTSVMNAFQELQENISKYNKAVKDAASTIENNKKRLGSVDQNVAQVTLNKLLVAKNLYSGELKGWYAQYNILTSNWQRLDKEKGNAKTSLDTYTSTVMGNYESSINDILQSFKAGFRIINTAHDYKGTGSPRSTFQIEINGVAVNPGDGSTPIEEPSFKNTLSAGDRSALAFAFFWAQLQSRTDLSNTIIVLDDPFSSQDGVRRTATAYKAVRSNEVAAAAQMILLSHDVGFLRLAKGYLTDTNRLQCCVFGILGDPNNCSVINPYNLDLAVRTQYQNDKEAVQLYIGQLEGSELDIIRKFRPLLETYYATHFPLLFKPEHTLGDISSAIRSVGETHPLYSIMQKLEEINLYTRDYHHGSDAGQQPAIINSNELRGKAIDVLSIIGSS